MNLTTIMSLIKFLADTTIAAARGADYLPVGVNARITDGILIELLFIGHTDFLRVMISVVALSEDVMYVTVFVEAASAEGDILFSSRIGDCIIVTA